MDNNTYNDYRVSLKEFILRIMDEREKSIEQRLNKLNELRDEVTSDREQYLQKPTFEVQHKALVDKVEGLQRLVYIGLGAILVLELVVRWLF